MEADNNSKKIKLKILTIYISGIILWGILWIPAGGYSLMTASPLLWFPYVAAIVILLINMFLWSDPDRDAECDNYEKELAKIQYLERNAAHMVTAITGALIIAAAISAIKENAPVPGDVILFESAAFICAVVGVLPKYWIPSKKGEWMMILRHLKTVPFTWAISLFLAGLLMLLDWM